MRSTEYTEKRVSGQLQPTPDAIDDEVDDSNLDIIPTEEELITLQISNPERTYFRELVKAPLLTGEQEHAYFTRLNRINAQIAELQKKPSSKTTHKPLAQLNQEAQEIKDIIVLANTRLMISVAKRYLGKGLSLFDLIHYGTIGVLRAIRTFRVAEKVEDHRKFSTAARGWIKYFIRTSVIKQSTPFYLEVREVPLYAKFLAVFNRLSDEHNGVSPSFPDIREEFTDSEADDETLQDFFIYRQYLKSLERPLSEFNNSSEELLDVAEADSDEGDGDESIDRSFLLRALSLSLSELSDLQILIVQLRFGLIDGVELNKADTLRKLEKFGIPNVTRALVAKEEKIALHILRNHLELRQTYTELYGEDSE